MLENCRSAKDRWGGVSDIIDRWLQERQDLLVQYCDLSAQAVTADNAEEVGEKLRKLCQIMVDYLSAGHFEVYDQLIKEGREFDDEDGLQQAKKLFAIIDVTTEAILDFNDKYLETDDLETLTEDLSKVGQSIEERFEAEDRMIAVLHVAHKDLVA